MALELLPVERDLIVFSGATFRFVMRWLPGGVPQDFTGWDAWLTFGPSVDEEPLRELTVSNDGIHLYSDGRIELYMSDDETYELAELDIPPSGDVGKLVYSLRLQLPNGDVWAFMRGNLFINHDVGRVR